jgi:glucoamylase
MRFFFTSLIAVPLLYTAAIANPTHHPTHNRLDAFIKSERAIALQGALNNIGPNGSAVPGAGAGYVVASPSKVNPNCESQ